MNSLENWFCATGFWRNATQRRLLPAMLDGWDLGNSVLELGAGPGAATPALRQKFSRVTSLEYSAAFAAKIARDAHNLHEGKSPAQTAGAAAPSANAHETARAMQSVQVVQGDAAQLPFGDASFSCAIAILMLHHLRSRELQDRALGEVLRVLEPGGIFLAFEINDGWLQRLLHTRSTFVPFAAGAANARLNAAGFARVSVDFLRGGFLLRATRSVE
ncbi:MAG TPA: class I SAM-dependent methyltransferase [Candidatus Acidoferrum sp.]|nr:class I SAM-dependent methyltransferase [Candidatus Acidoferrum sp.]